MDWGKLLGAVAPTLATALGGPLAGLGVEAIGKAFGMEQPTIKKVQDAFTQGQLTGDQIAALREAEFALHARMKELDIQEEQLVYADRDSARKMQTSTRSIVPPLLAGIVVALVCFAEGSMLLGKVGGEVDHIVLGRILGTLDSALMLVLNFYFGSSIGSERKTEIIAAQGSTP